MAKSKRPVSAAQRDKFAISLASILKKKGVISKQAKLHGGKYISRGVLAKVAEFQHLADDRYVARKVKKTKKVPDPKAFLKTLKEKGYQVTNGRVVVPNDPEFLKRLNRGEIVGVRPIKGGYMEEVTFPLTADTVGEFLSEEGLDALNELRAPGEQFAFTFEGNLSFQAFRSLDVMKKYLSNYKQDAAITALKFFRIRPEDVTTLIPNRETRERLRGKRPRTQVDRRRKSRRLENLHPTIADKMRKKERQKYEAKKQKLANDPAKLEAYRAAGRARARTSYQKRKPKR